MGTTSAKLNALENSFGEFVPQPIGAVKYLNGHTHLAARKTNGFDFIQKQKHFRMHAVTVLKGVIANM